MRTPFEEREFYDVDSNNSGQITDDDDPISNPSYEVDNKKFIGVGWDVRTDVELNIDSDFDWTGFTFTITYDNGLTLFDNDFPDLTDPDDGYIASGSQIPAASLVAGLTYYMSGIALGSGQITLTGTKGTLTFTDTVSVAAVLDLDTDSNNNGPIESSANYDAATPTEDMLENDGPLSTMPVTGKVVLKGGAPAETKLLFSGIDLSSPEYAGYSIRLIAAAGLNVWSDPAKTTRPACTDPTVPSDDTLGETYIWSGSTAPPSEVYVEGSSTGERDLQWQLFDASGNPIARDTVKITVVEVKVEQIAFNYDTGSHSSDAMNLRENYAASSSFVAPEYTSTKNDEVLYKAGSDANILVRFTITPAIDISLKIEPPQQNSWVNFGLGRFPRL